MSFLDDLIGTVIRPIIDRKVRSEMCSEALLYSKEDEDSEVSNAGDLEGRKRGGSTGAATPEGLHRVSNKSTS